MTPEERQKLEEEYPTINVPRLIAALSACGVVMLVAWIFI